MISRTKTALACGILALGTLIGWRAYLYFTHDMGARIFIKSLKEPGIYKDNLECVLCGEGGYKISAATLLIDEKPVALKNNGRIGRSSFELPVTIDLSGLENGKHKLVFEVCDSSYHKNKSSLETSFVVDNIPFQAVLPMQDYKIDQGRTAHLRINTNKETVSGSVKFLSRTYDIFPEAPHSTTYECFLPTECEEQARENMFTVELADGAGNSMKLSGTVKINQVDFKRQQGFVVASSKLEDEKESSMSSKILDQALEQWLPNSPKEKLWSGNFVAPLNIKRIVTPFGEIRTTREKGRYQHKAVDLIDTPRSVVWAAQSGKVIIKDRYLMSGNTVAIDHGHGIVSLYYHLNDFADIEVGDLVKKGNPIGSVGMTGYASGYHLHWEVRVQGIAVDPMQWLERSF